MSNLEDFVNINQALEDFYEEAIHEAIKQTRVKEKEIRKWCQDKLITSSGTRSIIHREHNSTGGLNNSVVDILESKYLIRREWRSGASWYELTHDRLIKPIREANRKWKDGIEQERKYKRNRNLKIVLPATLVAVIIFSILLYTISYNKSMDRLTTTDTLISISTFGSPGSGDGQFNGSYGIGIDSSGKVYVVDNGNNRVQKFDSNGNFIAKWGSNGTADGQFEGPNGIGIDSSGKVYVSDNKNNRIQKFDSNGNFITKWGSKGSGMDNSIILIK